MPALVASRCDPHAKAFFESLLARKKARLQALIAVARKLLHAIYGIFRSGLKYEGTKLFPRIKRCPDPISFRSARLLELIHI
jgi:transposase